MALFTYQLASIVERLFRRRLTCVSRLSVAAAAKNPPQERSLVFLKPMVYWSGVARQLVPLFCSSKIKEPNKKTPHAAGFASPALLNGQGGCGTRPQKAPRAQTVLADFSLTACATRRDIRGQHQVARIAL